MICGAVKGLVRYYRALCRLVRLRSSAFDLSETIMLLSPPLLGSSWPKYPWDIAHYGARLFQRFSAG